MIGNTRFVFLNSIVGIFFLGCMLKGEGRIVKIVLNPGSSGWYFIEFKEDSLMHDPKTINVYFNVDNKRLQEIIVSKYNKFDYLAFDSTGAEMSDRMKLSGYLSHMGTNFFEFYNPSEDELERVHNWSIVDSVCRGIWNRSRPELDSLLKDEMNLSR